MEKKLRVFDLSELAASAQPGVPATIPASAGFEIGEGVHTGSIKFICWTSDPNIVVTASDKTIRWLDLPSRACIRHEVLDGDIKSCEMVSLAPEYTSPSDIGGGKPVLAVAAGKVVYFWGGPRAMDEIKRISLPYTIASVALDVKGRKLVVGEEPGTWAKVIRFDDEREIDTHKGHHGPIWSIAFSPTESCTRRAPKTAPSSCGRTATATTVCGVEARNVRRNRGTQNAASQRHQTGVTRAIRQTLLLPTAAEAQT